MGAMKRSPASRRPPRGGEGSGGISRGGGGGVGGGLSRSDGGSGSGALPGSAGGGGDKAYVSDPTGKPAGAAIPTTASEALPATMQEKGFTASAMVTPRKASEGQHGSARSSKEPEGPPEGDGGEGRRRSPDRSLAGVSENHRGKGAEVAVNLGDGNEGPGIFSGFLVLCTNCEDEGFAEYKQKIEALGGEAVTGFYYGTATHIAIEGNIPPGARAIWEGDGKVVTTTSWIESCFKDRRLLPNPLKDSSESLLPDTQVTPLAKMKSSTRSCASDGKLHKHRHGSSVHRSSRRKLKFSPCGLYHNLLSCEADKRRSEMLYDYALRFRTYENRTLPGRRKCFKLCKVSTTLILGRSYNQMACLHEQGKSLGGQFTAKNFRIYEDDTVMLDVVESQLVAYSVDEGNKDYISFVKMVKEEVFHNQTVPIDMVEWLSIMSEGVRNCHPNVLSNFIYLMEPFQSFGAFVTMYLLFSSIENTAGWGDLSNALSEYDYWKLPRSSIMQKTFGYIDHNGYLTQYEADVRGLLRLLWNCSKHKAKRVVKSFVHMVLAEYPKLLSDLQRALHEGGYLSHLKLKSQQ